MSITDAFDKRDRCYFRYGGRYCHSSWYYWGRWVLAGAALLVFFIVLLSCLCIARRRRRRGAQPYYGTGWMAPPPKYGNHQNDYQLNQGTAWGGQAYQPNPPPPAYPQYQHQPQYTGTTFNPNAGYYGQQQYPDMQSPPNTYQPQDNVYPPPPAAPGTK